MIFFALEILLDGRLDVIELSQFQLIVNAIHFRNRIGDHVAYPERCGPSACHGLMLPVSLLSGLASVTLHR